MTHDAWEESVKARKCESARVGENEEQLGSARVRECASWEEGRREEGRMKNSEEVANGEREGTRQASPAQWGIRLRFSS